MHNKRVILSPAISRLMLDRIVAIAVAVAFLCFLLVIVWPTFEDDPPTLLQTVYVTAGVIFATACALFYFSGPS